MQRALYLATLGSGRVSPNPMVGAVIAVGDRIIGEGYHRVYGGPHAEPNAVRSVKESDRPLLPEATMYVTLEPCSHYGKTPPCADLLIETGFRRVVIATRDPFPKVSGAGIEKLRQAGVEVSVGLLGAESRWLNRRFFTAHTLGRPYILLKWAQSRDGYIGLEGGLEGGRPVRISNAVSEVWMHRERSLYDAILVGTGTVISDNPSLTCRLWPSREGRPLRVTFDSPRLPADCKLEREGCLKKRREENLEDFLKRLYTEEGITSLMVEGGRKTLQSFIDADLWDEARVETSPTELFRGVKAPVLIQD